MTEAATPPWTEGLCNVALVWRTGDMSIRERFIEADPPRDNWDELRTELERYLGRQPELVQAWQGFSDDQRGSPAPFMSGAIVGFIDDGREDVTEHQTTVEACADFITRQTAWVLDRTRVRP